MFLRANLLRSYYTNRAPITFNIQSKWLKEDTIVKKPVGLSPNGKVKFQNTKVFKNFEALKLFMNQTLQANDDIYFVTAKEAIEWVKRLDFIRNSVYQMNLTEYLNESVIDFDLADLRGPDGRYDGKCEFLHQKQPDYNDTNTDGLEHLSGNKMTFKIVQGALRSESLFINSIFTYLFIALVIIYLGIIIYDKTVA